MSGRKLPRTIAISAPKGMLAEVRVADNSWSRFWGLIPQGKPLGDKRGLLLTHCSSVHGFFMRITIDVVFINEKWEVVKTSKNCRPWRYLLWAKGAKYALEIDAGMAERLGMQREAALDWKIAKPA